MKWVALLVFILVGIGFTLAIRKDGKAVLLAAFMLGFLPFVMAPWHLYVAPYSFAGWPGYVKGWEIGLIDAIAVACLISVPKAHSRLPFQYVFLLYLFSAFASVFFAANFNYALAYPIQLARVFLVFAAVARLSASPNLLKVIFGGLIVGITYQAIVAVSAKLGGALQTGGSLGHQNLLGFVSHLVFVPAFGLFLSGHWRRLAVLGLVSGGIVVISTVSRATVGVAAISLLVTYLFSLAVGPFSRKIGLGFAAAALFALSSPLIHYSFAQRFAAQGNVSFVTPDKEREAFEQAAAMIIDDHPLGIGANHYVVIMNTQGYASRAGVTWGGGSRATNVHNSFLLIQAETGYLGLFAILLFLATTTSTCLTYAFAGRQKMQADLLIGIAGAMFAITLHSLYEWMLVTHQAQYLLAVTLGVAAGLIRQLKAEKKSQNSFIV